VCVLTLKRCDVIIYANEDIAVANLSERTTVYLNPYVKKYLQHEAVEQGKSISELINDQLAELLEDAQDLATIEERKSEPVMAWDKVKADLVRDGLL
jgi:hypothetical protein